MGVESQERSTCDTNISTHIFCGGKNFTLRTLFMIPVLKFILYSVTKVLTSPSNSNTALPPLPDALETWWEDMICVRWIEHLGGRGRLGKDARRGVHVLV